MNELTMRVATEDDFAAVCTLYEDVIADVAGTDRDPKWSRAIHPCDADLHAAIATESLLVAHLDGVLVGSIVADQDFADGYDAVDWPSGVDASQAVAMHLLAVDPTKTNKGLGAQVFTLAIEHARAKGYRAVRLDVLPWLAGPRHLYEKLGFVDLGLYALNYPDPRVREFSLYELTL